MKPVNSNHIMSLEKALKIPVQANAITVYAELPQANTSHHP